MTEEKQAETYHIKTAAFEGPFGLLLDLVEKRKLFINDVSLADVTEDYLSTLGSSGPISPNRTREVSGFVQVAATLILIKSKSLLPDLTLTTEEEGDIKNLEERLRLYELFTRLGINIRNSFGKNIIFAPQERKNNVVVFLPDGQITKESMMAFAKEALGGMPKKIILPNVEVRKVISLEEMIDKLTDRIKSAIKMSFSEFSMQKSGKPASREDKVIVIVSFLAMLELVRNGILDATQENNDIIIQTQEAQ